MATEFGMKLVNHRHNYLCPNGFSAGENFPSARHLTRLFLLCLIDIVPPNAATIMVYMEMMIDEPKPESSWTTKLPNCRFCGAS